MKMRGRIEISSNIPKKEHDSSSHIVKDFLIPIGSLLIAAIGLFAGKDKLPDWALYIVIFYLIAVILAILWKPTTRLYLMLRLKQINRYLAKTFYPLLHDSAKEFAQLIIHGRSDTIIYLLQDINKWDEFKTQPIQLDAEHIATIRSWYAYIERHFDFYKLKDLFYLASELSNLIFQYHRLCTHAHKQLDSLVATGKLEGQRLQYLKQEWNLRRERHNIFINKWENIAKNINTATGEMSCHDYYELLKTLE